MKDERFYELLSRSLASEATIQELEELNNMLLKHPDLAVFHELITNSTTHHQEDLHQKEKAEAAYLVHSTQLKSNNVFSEKNIISGTTDTAKTHRSPIVSLRSTVIGLLAAASVISFAILLRVKIHPVTTAATIVKEIATRKGDKSKITLSDGSIVLLNSDSRLLYTNFKPNNRELTLIGEAYFDIVKDSLHPLIIHAGDVTVKVLGTSFNLKAYPDENTVETVLISGLVELSTSSDQKRKILLRPNEKAVIYQEKTDNANIVANKSAEKNYIEKPAEMFSISKLTPDKIDSSVREIAWKDNRLIFKSERFEDLAKRMERWFDIEIVFMDNRLKDLLFTGKFERHTTEQAFADLQYSCNFQFTYTKKDSTIIIYPK